MKRSLCFSITIAIATLLAIPASSWAKGNKSNPKSSPPSAAKTASGGAKGIKGYPIASDPAKLDVMLVDNLRTNYTVTFTSKKPLQNITLWVVPALRPYISVEPGTFPAINTNGTYQFTVSAAAPAGTSPDQLGGTIHFRQGKKTVAKPLPVKLKISRTSDGDSAWPYRRYDLPGTACNNKGSRVITGSSLSQHFTIPGTDYWVLTGDVDGDGNTEIVTTSGSALKIYSGNGSLEKTIYLPRPGELCILEDADGDGILDIGLGGNGIGFAGYLYKADGSLLRSFAGQHGGNYSDINMALLTISKGKVLVGYNAGYAMTPRGVASFNYTTGAEEWYYQIGPANGIYSVADLDTNGVLDIVMNSATVHNGASGNGTTDSDLYLIVVDEAGANKLSLMYPSPSHGNAMHVFQDMDKNGSMDIVAFEGHDEYYYPGQSQIHIYDQQGSTTYTFDGPQNISWQYATGDLDNDGTFEVIATAVEAQTTYVLNNSLQEIRKTTIGGAVNLICDLTGDGNKEIVLLTTDGWLRILDASLNLIAEVKCGNQNGNVIASDVDGDGIVEILVQTDQLYVYSF